MTQVGKTISGMVARLDEAREAQRRAFAIDLFAAANGDLPSPQLWEDMGATGRRHWSKVAERLELLGYRKVST